MHAIIEMARERDILCQGRGSAANSAVCYCLGITSVDPARSNLLFERFLSAERREPPDIDVDFEHERREEVIQAIYETYGRDCAAMVSEIISYRGKSALREVGKAFGLSLEQVDRLGALVSWWDKLDEIDGERVAACGFDPKDARVRQVLAMAHAIQGYPRHLSIHVGGFVLSAEPLVNVAPVEPATMADRTVIPWDKEAAGAADRTSRPANAINGPLHSIPSRANGAAAPGCRLTGVAGLAWNRLEISRVLAIPPDATKNFDLPGHAELSEFTGVTGGFFQEIWRTP